MFDICQQIYLLLLVLSVILFPVLLPPTNTPQAYTEELVDLHRRLMALRERNVLQQVCAQAFQWRATSVSSPTIVKNTALENVLASFKLCLHSLVLKQYCNIDGVLSDPI